MEGVCEVAKDRAAFAVSQGIADKEPLNCTDDHGKDGGDHCCERVRARGVSGVGDADGGDNAPA